MWADCRHESLRVFEDKLIDEQEKHYLQHMRLQQIVEDQFPDLASFVLRDPIIWTEFESALKVLEAEEKADISVKATFP